MGIIADAFMNPTGPKTGEISVISVTTASAHTDLTAAAEAVSGFLSPNEILTLVAEGDVWYRWSLLTTGETVDETATTGNNRAGWIAAGERLPERPPAGCQGIVCKAPVACKLRIYRGARPDY